MKFDKIIVFIFVWVTCNIVGMDQEYCRVFINSDFCGTLFSYESLDPECVIINTNVRYIQSDYCGTLFAYESERVKIDDSSEEDIFEECFTALSSEEDLETVLKNPRYQDLYDKIARDEEELHKTSRFAIGSQIGRNLSIALTKFGIVLREIFDKDLLSGTHETLDDFIGVHRDKFFDSVQNNLIGGEDATINGLLNQISGVFDHVDEMAQNLFGSEKKK